MRVKVLVYGYATGVFSSRKIARKLHEDLAFRVLGAGNFLKHRTVCDFRALHLNELAALFVQVVKLDIPAEIARREKRLLAIQAAKERLEQRQREADTQRGRTPCVDDDRDNDAQPPGAGEAPKPEVPKKPGRTFKRAFGEPAPKAQDNFTDPDSRLMKTSAGFEQCFNAQTGVDAHAQIIVAAELTNCGADSGELPRMLEVVEHNTGRAPELALADTAGSSTCSGSGSSACEVWTRRDASSSSSARR